MHEIVTLQLGQQANYVGTHFWNTQESYFTYGGQEESPVDHDIHFRAGVGADGSDTYLPRAVIYDFKSSFGTLRKLNELYEVLDNDQRNSSIWAGTTATQTQPPIAPSPYQTALSQGLQPPKLQLSDVRYWSDYNRIYHHPRSLVQIYETDLGPEQRGFDTWISGEDLFKQLDSEHDLFDRDVRPVVEECDQMQGLQLLTSVEGGWGGFASRYVERLRDELGKTGLWVWALGEGGEATAARRANRIVNQARAIHEISTAASLYVPLLSAPARMPPYMTMERQHPWHTSALQATAFETLTLPSRLRRSQGINASSLSDLAIALDPSDERKIAQARFEVKDMHVSTNGNGANGTLSELLQGCNLAPTSTTAEGDVRTFAEYNVSRTQETEDGDQVMGNGHDAEDAGHYRSFHSSLKFPLLDSFPSIFDAEESEHHTTSILAQLAVTSATSTWISNLERSARMRVSFEEREELSNSLKEIAEAYKAGFSDDEDDWDV